MRFLFLLWIGVMALFPSPVNAKECVVLLHGLARSANSFLLLEWRLKREGYQVVNVDYPSTQATIEELAETAIPGALDDCRKAETVHFVTHSMGGILLRHYMGRLHKPMPRLGNSVMLGPPNKGTPVVDQLTEVPGFDLWNGVAGRQLGTGADSLPLQLGPVTFPVGVIAGNQSVSPLLSAMMDQPNDGKVPVANTEVEGMADHIVLPVTHTFMMNNPRVMDQVLEFLKNGRFLRDQ